MKYRKYIALMCALTALLVGVPSAVGSYAYLSDSSKVTNDFTVAHIDINLLEPEYTNLPDSNSDGVKDDATHIVQGATIKANPKVKNNSTLGVYAFIVVDMPKQDVALTNTFPTKVSTELFSYNVTDGNWVLLETKDMSGHTRRIYGYTKEVPVGGETTSLFNGVKYANIVEGEIDISTVKSIPMAGYAIQAIGFSDMQDAYKNFDWNQKEVQ